MLLESCTSTNKKVQQCEIKRLRLVPDPPTAAASDSLMHFYIACLFLSQKFCAVPHLLTSEVEANATQSFCFLMKPDTPAFTHRPLLRPTGGVQNGTNLGGHHLLPGPAGQPLLMPSRQSSSRTFNPFV